jgi:hypothetical protein
MEKRNSMNEIEKIQTRLNQVKTIAEKLYEIEHDCADWQATRDLKYARENLDYAIHHLNNAIKLISGEPDE